MGIEWTVTVVIFICLCLFTMLVILVLNIYHIYSGKMAQLSSIVIAGQSYKYCRWLAYKFTINQ